MISYHLSIMEEQDDRQIGYVEGQDDEELKDNLMMSISIQRYKKLLFLRTGLKLVGRYAMERWRDPSIGCHLDDLK